ncbi:Translation elongation/initiation factor/Ribosomal, beta-barrel [Ostreococcus tauri]|uniref:H/ACA ribonucleoprotein complex subunit n=1 Tax=Ostreococcus tauri TaxID=70448 RepID=A0A090MBL4_OSTTA|nr:Translation elongation/initiation factor/Ribosomal, beta-barrel [Ostreococcus tauri]CEG00974.1 Translation elongation/initiation factor/Ribosomal, beta-barrel [Ostreococcus tauri]|eukprot:XP_022840712.1 Translation elongation/initiation factor/Ribosomal, beta-barrel [Ostreococcus tauri]
MRPPSYRGARGSAGRTSTGGRSGLRFDGRGRGRGRSGQFRDEGPPSSLEEIGTFLHACEGEIVCLSTNKKVPYFNGAVYLENKTQVGKVEEIFGPVNDKMFTVKLIEGVNAESYEKGAKFYISPDKLLPVERFINPVSGGRASGRGRAGRAPGMRGGRGGRGTARGAARGRGGRSRF